VEPPVFFINFFYCKSFSNQFIPVSLSDARINTHGEPNFQQCRDPIQSVYVPSYRIEGNFCLQRSAAIVQRLFRGLVVGLSLSLGYSQLSQSHSQNILQQSHPVQQAAHATCMHLGSPGKITGNLADDLLPYQQTVDHRTVVRPAHPSRTPRSDRAPQ